MKFRIKNLRSIATSDLRVLVVGTFICWVLSIVFNVFFPSVKYWGVSYVREAEFHALRNWYAKHHEVGTSDSVAVVLLDDWNSVVNEGPLPWTAFQYAELIDRLREYGVSVIGFDAFVQQKPSLLTTAWRPYLPTVTIPPSAAGELAFQASVRRHGRVYFVYPPVTRNDQPSDDQSFPKGAVNFQVHSSPEVAGLLVRSLETIELRVGYGVKGKTLTPWIKIPSDRIPDTVLPQFVTDTAKGLAFQPFGTLPPSKDSGYVARMVLRMGNQYAASLPVALASSYEAEIPSLEVTGEAARAIKIGRFKVPTTSWGGNFLAPKGDDVIWWSASDILQRRASHEKLTGRIVLIGLMGEAATLTERNGNPHPTPLVLLDAFVTDGLCAARSSRKEGPRRHRYLSYYRLLG